MKLRSWARYIALGPLVCLLGCNGLDRSLLIKVSTEEPAPSIAEAMRPLLEARGFSVEIQPDDNAKHIVDAIRNGTADLAVVEEPLRLIPGVVTLAPLYPSVLHVLYRDRSRPASFADLIRDRKIYAGPVEGAAYRLLMRLGEDFGVTADEITILDNPWTQEPEVYFIFGGLLSEDSLRQLDGYRLYSFGDVEQIGRGSVADAMALRYPNLKSFVLPARTYHALNDAPVVTLAIRSVLIAHATLDYDLAYEIASQLFDNAQEIAFVYPLATQELNASFDPASLTFKLHPGARRYIERDKPSFLERYAELLALAFAVAIALVSAAIGVYKHRKQRQKDHVDVYYGKILALRAEIEPDRTAEELQVLQQDVMNVQREVLTLLIDERISADTTLTVFLDLSNRVLNELDHRIAAA